jgi:two-component system sensor histidine kinase RegB
MPDLVDRTLALRWLASARRATLAAQLALMFFAEAGTQIHIHSPALIVILLGWGAVDVFQAAWFRRRPPPARLIGVSAAIDLAALTGMLVLSGGQHSPLLFGYLAYLALLAMVLPASQAWTASVLAMLLQAFVVFHPGDLAGLPDGDESPAHLVGHVVTFDLSAAAITWVITRLSAALRERNEKDKEEQHRREVTARLAALGTLAAGVAHELGTPLGAIQLLAEKARRRDPNADPDLPLVTLLEQVARCRSILDRLRGQGAPSASECTLALSLWITEWQRSAPDVEVTAPSGVDAACILGAEESWRAAVWVALDNARKAGARCVVVKAIATAAVIEVAVEDDGRGLDPDAVGHAGEPFWTGWGGTGLGLFVSRSFAQSVGGDVVIEPAAGHGARTRILIPRASR